MASTGAQIDVATATKLQQRTIILNPFESFVATKHSGGKRCTEATELSAGMVIPGVTSKLRLLHLLDMV